jgi:hypothetical protein
MFSIQVNIVFIATELKTGLMTLAYDFCTFESFVAEANLCASGYEIFFQFLFFQFLSLFGRSDRLLKMPCEVDLGWSTSDALVVFLTTHEAFEFPFALDFAMSKFPTHKASDTKGKPCCHVK